MTSQIYCSAIENSYEQSQRNIEFDKKYEKWLPERIVSRPRPISSLPPIPDINKNLDFFGEVYKQRNKHNRLCRVHFQCWAFSKTDESPFPNFIKQLIENHYALNVAEVPLYSIFPLLGRFYYIDCPEGKEEDNVWVASVCRLKRDELPKDILLQNESIVFTITSELQNKYGDHSGHLYSYRIFVTEIEKITPDKEYLQAKIKVIGCGSRQIIREGWYKIGDAIEFSHFSHKVINIVASRELDKEIRGHKCNLIGYVELDPKAIPLENPKLEEIEILPDPPEPPAPKPELTNEEKAEMRNWKLIYPENKTLDIQAAFIKLKYESVTLRKPDTDYEFISLKYFCQSDQKLINNITEQRKKYSTEEGIDFELIPLTTNPTFFDEDQTLLQQVIGEKIDIALKITNVSNDIISICKSKLQTNNNYNVSVGNDFIRPVFNSRKSSPILFNQKAWITLKPKEEYLYPIPQNKFANWQLPRSGEKINFSTIGYYLFSFRHNRLDIPLEIRKKLIESGVPAKIYIGNEYESVGLTSIQIIPPPIEMKELLLQKSVKYIERTFSKNEVAEILKQNDGVDVYSENAKDQIKVFLQLYSLSPIELEKLLIKYSDIEGFDRMESVYRKLSMFNSDESKQTREKMKSVALEKYKKELTDMPIETNNINDDNENDLLNLSDQLTIPKSKDDSSKFWIILIICCFIVTILLVIVIITFRKRKSSPTNPASKL